LLYQQNEEVLIGEQPMPSLVLPIADNAVTLPPLIGDLQVNIKVVFLTSKPTFLIRPMDERIIAAFKACYLRMTFAQVIAASEEDTEKM
jgi:hypothetical protein